MSTIQLGMLSNQPGFDELKRLSIYFNSQIQSYSYMQARGTLQTLISIAHGDLIYYFYQILQTIPAQTVAGKSQRAAMSSSGMKALSQSMLNKTRRNQPAPALAYNNDGNYRLNLNQYTKKLQQDSAYPASAPTVYSYTTLNVHSTPEQSGAYYLYYYPFQQMNPQNTVTAFQNQQRVYDFVYQPQTQSFATVNAAALPGVPANIPVYPTAASRAEFQRCQQAPASCANGYMQLQPMRYAQQPAVFDGSMPQMYQLYQKSYYAYSRQIHGYKDQFSSNLEHDYTDEQILQEILGDQYYQIKMLQAYENTAARQTNRPVVCEVAAPQPNYAAEIPSYQSWNASQEYVNIYLFASPYLSKLEIPQYNITQLVRQAEQYELFRVIEAVMIRLLYNYGFSQLLLELCTQIVGRYLIYSSQGGAIRGCLNLIKINFSYPLFDHLVRFAMDYFSAAVEEECKRCQNVVFANYCSTVGLSEFVCRFALIKLMVVQ